MPKPTTKRGKKVKALMVLNKRTKLPMSIRSIFADDPRQSLGIYSRETKFNHDILEANGATIVPVEITFNLPSGK